MCQAGVKQVQAVLEVKAGVVMRLKEVDNV